jgi:hypothetical protein
VRPVQHCYVCGSAGYLVDAPIVLTGEGTDGPPSIAQCPRCQRFICSLHGEPLDLTGERRRGLFRKPGSETLTICCPFDRGVALGSSSDQPTEGR